MFGGACEVPSPRRSSPRLVAAARSLLSPVTAALHRAVCLPLFICFERNINRGSVYVLYVLRSALPLSSLSPCPPGPRRHDVADRCGAAGKDAARDSGARVCTCTSSTLRVACVSGGSSTDSGCWSYSHGHRARGWGALSLVHPRAGRKTRQSCLSRSSASSELFMAGRSTRAACGWCR